jgi:hypothetical protein
VRVYLQLRLTDVLWLAQVIFKLYAYKFPLISFFCKLGGCHIFWYLLQVRMLARGITPFGLHHSARVVLPKLESKIEFLAILRAMVRV